MAAAASDGITVPVLYNPYLAAGSRYTELADSAIQRLYHSNAFLLTSGLVCNIPKQTGYSLMLRLPSLLHVILSWHLSDLYACLSVLDCMTRWCYIHSTSAFQSPAAVLELAIHDL